MTIFHSFGFFNELELLPLKLEELWDVVDCFILIEAINTFSGNSKRLYYQEHQDRFKKYEEKIHHAVIALPPGPDNWVRERFQREAAIPIVKTIGNPDDILLISDMDEIISAEGVRTWLAGDRKPTKLAGPMYYYYFNNQAMMDEPWAGGNIMYVRDIAKDLTDIRYDANMPVIQNACWHFSFLGGPERIKYKIHSYAHNELLPYVLDPSHMKNMLEQGVDFFVPRNLQFKFVPLDSSFPHYLRENIDQYMDMIYPTE